MGIDKIRDPAGGHGKNLKSVQLRTRVESTHLHPQFIKSEIGPGRPESGIMARPQTPLAKAALTGADKKDPQRYRDRKEPKTSGRNLGKPPAYLPATAKKAWGTFADELPWLTYEDRGAVEIVSLMRAHIIEGKTADLPASFFGNYRMALSALGATPVDRSKVFQPSDDDKEDPFGFLEGPAQ